MTVANIQIDKIRLKRGNTSVSTAYTGVVGEITMDTTLKTIRVHDGVTVGGTRLATHQELSNVQTSLLDTLTSNAAAQGAALNDLVSNAAAQATSLTNLVANAVIQAQQIANGAGTYGNANVQSYMTVFDGNILPSANVTYSLGSEQFQWRDLWVSNNTIYIGGTPVQVDGGTLLVNNAPVSGGAYGNTQIADYLMGNISTGNITAAANVMVIGTGDAKLTLDSFNQAALLQAKKTFNRSFDEGDGASFVYSNVAGTGSITATITGALYLKTLLERLSSQFSTPTPEFTYSYSNVRVQVYDVTNANVIANVTGVDNYGNPDEYTLLIDQPPTPDPFSVLALDISYDYLNTVGVDVDKDLFGITTDNDDIDIKSGRDISLQARDDFFVTAGSQFTMTLNANDGQGPSNGIILETQANGTTRSWVYRFDGATEFPGDLALSGNIGQPDVGFVNSPGTDLYITAGNTQGCSQPGGDTIISGGLGYGGVAHQGGNVRVRTGNYYSNQWNFAYDGNLTLPGGGSINGSDYDVDITAGNDGASTFGHISFTANGPNGLNSLTYNSLGEITVVTAGANDGLVKWVGNSSGDGNGYTTMVMVPDTTVEGNDQYIILDPTAVNHIHIRAGGTQDNSNADLFLGGETSYFRVESGLNPNVSISANNSVWNFGTDGTTLFPNNATIATNGNLTIRTPGPGNTISVTQEGGTPGISGQQTITAQLAGSPGIDLIQPGWTVTGNNLTTLTTVSSVSGPDGFGTYTITTDTTEVDPFWYNDVYTFTSTSYSQFVFGANANLVLPAGGTISEQASPTGLGNTITLTPAGGGDPNQQLKIYPTGGEGNHVHLASGDLHQTMLYLGDDNFYVRLNTSGSIDLQTNDGVAAMAFWQFGTDGNLSFPTGGNLIFDSSAASVIDGVTNITANGNVTAAQYNFANGVPILDTIVGITSINASVATSTISDASGDFSYGSLSYDYAVNGVTAGGFTISYSAPLVHGNVDVNVGNVIATSVSTSTVITTPAAFGNLVAVSGARAFVNDANIVAAGNFGAAISGGGANTAPVWSDGVSWYIG